MAPDLKDEFGREGLESWWRGHAVLWNLLICLAIQVHDSTRCYIIAEEGE